MNLFLIPPMLSELVYSACTGIRGTVFCEVPVCSGCGGSAQVHDTISRRFSRVLDAQGEQEIPVLVRRYQCRGCGKYLTSPAPFYEQTRFGSPVVDLCRTIARNHSYSQTAGILLQMGIVLDRGTVRNLVRLNHKGSAPEAENFIGLWIPLSIIRLSALVSMHVQPTPVPGREVLSACGWDLPAVREPVF